MATAVLAGRRKGRRREGGVKMEAEAGVVPPKLQATIRNPGRPGVGSLINLQKGSTLCHLDFRLLASQTVNQFLNCRPAVCGLYYGSRRGYADPFLAPSGGGMPRSALLACTAAPCLAPWRQFINICSSIIGLQVPGSLKCQPRFFMSEFFFFSPGRVNP